MDNFKNIIYEDENNISQKRIWQWNSYELVNFFTQDLMQIIDFIMLLLRFIFQSKEK